jgi:tetratricopeptide (TPR) repeat protein
VVASLAERSLIALDRGLQADASRPGAARYRMLETIRQYCAGQIARSDGPDGDAAARAAHCTYFADLARRASQGLTGGQQGRWLSDLEADYANLTAALNYLLGEPLCTVDALQMIVDLDRFWHNRGHLSECVALIRRGLAAAGANVPTALRSAVLSLAGQAALKFDLEAARTYFTAALELADSTDDDARAATALWGLSWQTARSGDLAGGRDYARAAVERARQTGDLVLLGECLLCVSEYDDDPRVRAACYEECLDVTSHSGDRIYTALVHNNLGNYALAEGDLSGALPHFELAQAILQEIGAPNPWPVLNCGWVHLRRANIEAATAAFTDALTMSELHQLRFEASYPILGLACSAAAVGQWARAACILGLADAELASCGASWPEPEKSYRDDALGVTRRQLGSHFERFYEICRRADRGDMIDFALRRQQLLGTTT